MAIEQAGMRAVLRWKKRLRHLRSHVWDIAEANEWPVSGGSAVRTQSLER